MGAKVHIWKQQWKRRCILSVDLHVDSTPDKTARLAFLCRLLWFSRDINRTSSVCQEASAHIIQVWEGSAVLLLRQTDTRYNDRGLVASSYPRWAGRNSLLPTALEHMAFGLFCPAISGPNPAKWNYPFAHQTGPVLFERMIVPTQTAWCQHSACHVPTRSWMKDAVILLFMTYP